MTTLKLLDLFSGAGGASMGYSQAGFEVTGVDIIAQPHYPFDFIQGDALEYVVEHGHEFDVIVASPPCQAYAKTNRLNNKDYPDLVAKTRDLIKHKPYVIENVVGAPLKDPITLCGAMFGLKVYRHRIFESNVKLKAPEHPDHQWPIAKMGRVPKDGEFMHVVGNFSGKKYAEEAMEINWMNRNEMSQAIPPAFSKFVGTQLKELIN